MNLGKSYTKSSLVTEVAGATGLSKAAVGRILDQLTQIAYREAERGFVIPGICKLKVVKKKASRHRNPVTGRLLLIGERLAVKIVPLKKAKSIITPNRDVTVQVIDDLTLLDLNAPAEASVPQPPVHPPDSASVSNAPVPAVQPSGTVIPESEEGQIVFPCPECGSMIAAPPKAAGQKGDCPFCKANLVVPQRHLETRPDKQVLSEQTAPSGAGATDFVAFVCRACGQEIEAPVDMVGMSVECPTCGSGLKVPIANAPKVPPAKTTPTAAKSKADMSSMTIRIDLSDLQ
jgi:DNA-binding protein HU-beta